MGKSWKSIFGQKSQAETREETIADGEVEYIGGHKAHPSGKFSKIYFYEDRMEIAKLNLIIPYKSIRNLDNSREKRRHDYWAALGLLGYAFLKRHAVFTLIEYDDAIEIQRVILDFHENVDDVQRLIYKKMLEFRGQ